MSNFKWRDCYASYVNLDYRVDRDVRMKKELERAGISAVRQKGIVPNEYKGDKSLVKEMMDRTPGALGCWLSQVAIMEKALSLGKGAIIMEDDLRFCNDIIERLDCMELFMNHNSVSVMWLGATFHKEPTWHKLVNGSHSNPEIRNKCLCSVGKDWEPTHDNRFVKTFGIWSTYAYMIPFEHLEEIIYLLKSVMSKSIGIDHAFIMLEPKLNTFAFVPGSVIQVDGQSNIGKGTTYFSHFASLGSHWFQDKISDYDNSLMK